MLKALKKGSTNFSGIQGLWYKEDKEIKKSRMLSVSSILNRDITFNRLII